MYRINWSRRATKQLQRIERADQKRITAAVRTLENPESAANVKALTNHAYGYRLRVGNYRVLFDTDTMVRIVEIQEVVRRSTQTY